MNLSPENQTDHLFQLSFDEQGRRILRSLAIWASVCAITAFISYGLNIMQAWLLPGRVVSEENANVQIQAIAKISVMTGTVLSVLLGTALNYFLIRFSAATRSGIDQMDQGKLNAGFSNLKVYFKFIGILCLICLAFAGLGLIIVLIAALVGR